MYLVRDIMYCKPGQVRSMVEKFKKLSKVMKKRGYTAPRILTDISAERYWTVVSEQEVNSLEEYAEISHKIMSNKELQKVMKGYHSLVDKGRREIYMIEK
jgi:broad-specificity NMP kinase